MLILLHEYNFWVHTPNYIVVEKKDKNVIILEWTSAMMLILLKKKVSRAKKLYSSKNTTNLTQPDVLGRMSRDKKSTFVRGYRLKLRST